MESAASGPSLARRPAHRHRPEADAECRAATLAELRRSHDAAMALLSALELGDEQLDPELRAVLGVAERIGARIRALEEIDRGRG